MIDLPHLIFIIAAIFFVVAGVITARSRNFDWHNFGLALVAFGLFLSL